MTGSRMLSVESETRREREQPAKPFLHIYPTGGRKPVPGDVAHCGWVKKSPPLFPDCKLHRPGYQYCVVCVDLRGGLS